MPASGRFFSLPRRAMRTAPPVRPVRNYSTLGPSRPPRRSRQQQQGEQYVEIDEGAERLLSGAAPAPARSDEEVALGKATSHFGEVAEWMKDRPLPPPPRPPRKHRESEETHALPESIAEAARLEAETESPLVAALREDDELVEEREPEEEMPAAEEMSAAEEASVATQTDPLPDDVCVEPASEEPPPVFADASTETETKAIESKQQESEEQTEELLGLSEESAKLKAEQEAARQAVKTTVPAEVAPAPQVAVPVTRTQPVQEPIVIEKPVPFYVMPDADTEVELKARRLEVSELDVGRLTVGELQARKMVVSDVDSVSLQAAEFGSKATHLAVNTLELPSGLLQELRDSLQPQLPPETISQGQAQSRPVETTVPQHTDSKRMSPIPPSTPPSVRPRPHAVESEEEEEQEAATTVVTPSVPSSVSRRRRHLTRPFVRHTSSDEEELELPLSRPMSRARSRTAVGAIGNETGVVELGRQLVAACQAAAAQALQRSMQYACSVASVDSEGRRRELQAVLCGLLVAVAALVLFGFGSGKTFHYHHWDYIFPPPGP